MSTPLEQAMAEKLSDADDIRQERWDAEREDRGSARANIEAAFQQSKAESAEAEDTERAVEPLAELGKRYGDKPAQTLKGFLNVDSDFRSDPLGAANRLADHYLRQPPRSAKPQEEEKPWWHDDPGEQGVRGAVRRAMRDAERKRAVTEGLDEVLPELKARFGSMPVSQLVASVVEQDENLARNPLETAARIATSYGGALTPHAQQQQAQQYEDQQVYRARFNDAQQFIDFVAPSMPGFSELADDIADVLESRSFQWTGVRETDLFNAYLQARDKAAVSHAAKARHAAVSIKGSPGGAASSSPGSRGSVAADIRSAMAALGA